jgi:hypothetical protein
MLCLLTLFLDFRQKASGIDDRAGTRDGCSREQRSFDLSRRDSGSHLAGERGQAGDVGRRPAPPSFPVKSVDFRPHVARPGHVPGGNPLGHRAAVYTCPFGAKRKDTHYLTAPGVCLQGNTGHADTHYSSRSPGPLLENRLVSISCTIAPAGQRRVVCGRRNGGSDRSDLVGPEQPLYP